MALNQLEQEDLRGARWGSSAHMHALIEAMRLAWVDTLQFCADPDFSPVPLDGLLSKQYAKQRRADISPDKARTWHVAEQLCMELLEASLSWP